jgi:uncharacterized protein YlxP (DUF503 family)
VDPRAAPAAAVLTVDLRLPHSSSLKDKRSVVKNLLEGARSRCGVAAAEVGDQDLRQRAVLGFAAVAGSVGHVDEVLDSVERLVWSRPDVEVIDSARAWLEL